MHANFMYRGSSIQTNRLTILTGGGGTVILFFDCKDAIAAASLEAGYILVAVAGGVICKKNFFRA